MNPPAASRLSHRRQGVRRAVVLMPNGLTLVNLLCGIYAIILAIRNEVASAPLFIVLGGIADTLDGRVARATGTGSRFGEELDSLVDAISFGFAPALIVYQGLPTKGTLEWLLVFIFTACAVMRLARFNVEQAGRKKTHFHGLPSPAAGLTLATYFWFSQTPLYNQAIILFTDSKTLAVLPWPTIMRALMAVLAALMISDVPYPTVPSIGFGSIKKILGTLMVIGSLFLLIFRREEFIFPALLAYVVYGMLKWLVLGFLGRSHSPVEVYGSEPKVGGLRPDLERRTPMRGTPAVGGKSAESRREARIDERAERTERPERQERLDRSERSDRPPRADRPDRPNRLERGDRTERTERGDRADRERPRSEDPNSPARRKRRRRGRGSRPPNGLSDATPPDAPDTPDAPGSIPPPPSSPPPVSPEE
jgi:CDP-diacylglycerol---serine O-phosphatidyltransferase